MNKDTILVVGASGTVGSELVRILRDQNYNVRKTTSRAVLAGSADQVFLDLRTGKGLKNAFEGVDKAFLLSPPGYSDQYSMLSPLIQEAKRQGLKKVVLMTAMGANANESSPFRRAELELEKSGLTYNIVRPNWFLQNFSTFWVQGIKQQGKILLPAGQAKTSFIDARDISAVVAKLLTSNQFDNQDLDLTGGESLDHDQVARAISEETGKKIAYQEIDSQTFKSGLMQAGLPEDYVDFMAIIIGFLKEGYNANVNSNVQKILGREPITVKKHVKDSRQAWL